MASSASAGAGASAAASAEASSMQFCASCNNMLYPREDRAARRLMFICVRCGYEQAAGSPVVFKHELVKSAGNQLAKIPDDVVDDASLLRSPSIVCPLCATADGVMIQAKPLATDDKIKVILVCCGCRHKWQI